MYIPHGVGVSKVNMLSARVYDWLQTWPGNQFGHSIPGLIYANSPRFPGPHRSAQMSLHFGWFSKLMTLHQLKVFAVIPCPSPSTFPTPMRCIPILLLSGLCFSLCSHFVSFSPSSLISLSLSLGIKYPSLSVPSSALPELRLCRKFSTMRLVGFFPARENVCPQVLWHTYKVAKVIYQVPTWPKSAMISHKICKQQMIFSKSLHNLEYFLWHCLNVKLM